MNNPQAFPRAGYDGPDSHDSSVDGMTLRDYFAAKAMQAIITTGFAREEKEQTVKDTAFSAYLMADAMLAEREKTQ